MSTSQTKLVRKGKPTHAQNAERELEHRGKHQVFTPPQVENHHVPAKTAGAATTTCGESTVAPHARDSASLAASRSAGAAGDGSTNASRAAGPHPRPIATAAAKASLQSNKDLASRIAELVRLLTRRRPATTTESIRNTAAAAPTGSETQAGRDTEVVPPPAPEELRPILDAIRDHCVAANNKTKFEGRAATANCSVAHRQEVNNDDLSGFYAITFLSTLYFASETEGMLRECLQSVTDRLRAAEAHGREELYHNAVVEAVNSILLFTPLTAPPVWLLNGQRQTTSESPSPRRRTAGTAATTIANPKEHAGSASTHGARTRRASVVSDTAAEAAMEDVAAFVRSVLYRLDYGDYDSHAAVEDADGGEAAEGVAGAAKGGGIEDDSEDSANATWPEEEMNKDAPRVLDDDCLDFLNTAEGSALLDEQHWFDAWLSNMLEGYVHLTAAAAAHVDYSSSGSSTSSTTATAVTATQEREASDEASPGAADEDADHRSASATVPTLLPRPVWRSAAGNAYAQFAVQLLAVFFSRGSDGSLNYCARVHKLVQYYHHRMRAEGEQTCTPIPSRNAVRAAAPPPRPMPVTNANASHRLPAERVKKVTQTALSPSEDEHSSDRSEGATGERYSKHVLVFHPSLEHSRRRGGDRAADFDDQPKDNEDPKEKKEEEMPESLTAGFSRQHKCYTAGEGPDMITKHRILMDVSDDKNGNNGDGEVEGPEKLMNGFARQHKCYTADEELPIEAKKVVAALSEEGEEGTRKT